jgi:hypothetical protein
LIWVNGEAPVIDRLFSLPFDRLAQPLGSAASELRFAAPFAGCRRRAGWNAAFPGLGCPTNEIDKPFISILTIALLCAETPSHDDENAIGGHPPSGEQTQSGTRRFVETRRVCRVEAKLDRGGDLVDVLSTGAAGPNEDLFDLVLVDRDAVGDRHHLR